MQKSFFTQSSSLRIPNSPSAMKMEDPATPQKPSASAAASPNLKIPASMQLPSLSTAIGAISEPPTPSQVHYERLINSSHNISPSRPIYSDRFIPSRTGSNFSLFNIDSPSSAAGGAGREESPSRSYVDLLRAALFGPEFGPVTPGTPGKDLGLGLDRRGFLPPPNRNIFRYKTETKRKIQSSSPFESNDSVPGVSYSPITTPRKIARSPSKVLDAPSLQDDYYLNLVDWSSNNVLAVGLANCVYLWNASSSKVTRLCDLGDDSVCSVGWAPRGANLAVGTNTGSVQIWDASNCKMIRSMDGHRLRTGSLSWSPNALSSGSRDKKILQRDIRAQDDYVSKLTGHKSEVCGLKWSYDNRELASGGNDNRLFVWNQHSRQPVLKYSDHTAAVKAIAWSPHSYGLLASGGGTADRRIRFWNTNTNSHLASVDTGSQVCNLAWSKNANELVSTHGYSQNQIIVWKYPTMSKLATLTGHTYRVLYLSVSPDGQTIVTGAGDETLRFWNVFPSLRSQTTHSGFGASSGRTHIR